MGVSCSDKDKLAEFGLPAGGVWSAVDSKRNTKFFQWMTEKEAARSKNVKLRFDGLERASGLVAPQIGLTEDDLAKYLRDRGVDIEAFGKGEAATLASFSAELIKGESSLTEGPGGDLLRVVSCVFLEIVKPTTGDFLVQTERICEDGSKEATKCLAHATCRPDENHIVAARR